jgi:hypothetical protein
VDEASMESERRSVAQPDRPPTTDEGHVLGLLSVRNGGFLLSGRAWRLQIPPASPLYGDSTANNVLKCLALAVTRWLQIWETPEPEECILSLADNRSALGWVYRSGKIQSDSWYFDAVNAIACKIVSVLIDSSHCLASQNLKGDHNDVADLLSFGPDRGTEKAHPLATADPPNDVLTQRFNSFLPKLIPQGFKISPLPNEILSFVMQVLQTSESSFTRKRSRPKRNETESCAVGSTFVTPAESAITLTSLEYPPTDLNFSAAPFYPSTGSQIGTRQESLLGNVRDLWSEALSGMQQASWLWRFGTVSNRAPSTSRTAPSCSHQSAPSRGPSTTLTPRQTASEPSATRPTLTQPTLYGGIILLCMSSMRVLRHPPTGENEETLRPAHHLPGSPTPHHPVNVRDCCRPSLLCHTGLRRPKERPETRRPHPATNGRPPTLCGQALGLCHRLPSPDASDGVRGHPCVCHGGRIENFTHLEHFRPPANAFRVHSPRWSNRFRIRPDRHRE